MILKWVRLSFLYLIILGLLGCLLRLVFFFPIEGINYKYFLHAHSHLAFLGWVFNALFAALIFAYIPDRAKGYKLLFWLLQLAVLGMLISFPIQGYAAVSIAFSTLHVFLSYWFAGKFYNDTKNQNTFPISLIFIRWSLFFMVISSFGPYALGTIMVQGLGDSNLYQLAIYFYLHFQYNGWFSFAVFGLFFWLLEVNTITFDHKYARLFLWLMTIACIPAYSLSALWMKPAYWVYIMGYVSAGLQVAGLVYFILLLKNIKLKTIIQPWVFWLLKFAFAAFVIKIALQFASAFPPVADLAYSIRNLTIGYLHIVFLGFVTIFLIAWFIQMKLLNLRHALSKAGLIFFISGFILSEVVLFLQPSLFMLDFGALPYYYQMLFWVSLLMPMGIMMLFFGRGIEITKSWSLRSSLTIKSIVLF